MVSLNRIRFGGIFINELNMPDLIMECAFDSDNSEVNTFLTREAVASESYDGRNRRISSFKYTENFAPKLTFIKNGFGDFSQDDIRVLLKYLTSKDTIGLLEAYEDDSNVISWASIGNFSEIQLYKLANKRVVGVTAVWDSISPFALSDLYTVTKTVSTSTDNKITINIDTDDNKPVYPRIIINHGYNNTPHSIVNIKLPLNKSFNNIADMADYVENTIYYNETDGLYYYKAYTPTFTTSDDLPEYVNWTTVEVDEKYTEESEMAADTFYYYEYEGMYYWMKDDEFHAEPTRPVYGDWKKKDGAKAYTANDTFEEKTIYSYNNKYYWMAPHSFYKSSKEPSLSTTSVKITNQHYDFFNQPSTSVATIVKNNTGTEKIVLDGANKIVSSDRARRIFGDDFNFQHLELYNGRNEIIIEGNCEVKLEWREIRKVGEY